ncbi:hypothetical protein Tco_0574346 [Tanacetum coccineum]
MGGGEVEGELTGVYCDDKGGEDVILEGDVSGAEWDRYGYCKNHKKTVKTRQTRTRERKRVYKSRENAFKVKHWSTLGQPKSTI